MEKNERVISHSRYNYYKYYDLYKNRYKMNYEERKQKKLRVIENEKQWEKFGNK